MLRIACPFCGLRDYSEFTYGGDATVVYPALDADEDAWHDAVFMRENVRGLQSETWHHVNGCRMWLIVDRDTLTHEIVGVRPAHPEWANVIATETGREKHEKPQA